MPMNPGTSAAQSVRWDATFVHCLLLTAALATVLAQPAHGSGIVSLGQGIGHRSPRQGEHPSFPLVASREIVLAQSDPAKAAQPKDPKALDDTAKRKVRSGVLLLTALAAIALSGLLVIIAAIAIRGLQRKLAGPTRLDRDPHDMLPNVAARTAPATTPPAAPDGDADASSEETQFT